MTPDSAALFNLMLMNTVSHLNEGASSSNKLLVELFHAIVATIRPSHFVEIGARQADFSIRIKKELPKTIVHAFEANPYTFEYYNTRRSFKDVGVSYHNLAVSSKPGQLNLNIPIKEGDSSLTRGNSSLKRRTDVFVEYQECDVQATCLDVFFWGYI